MSTMTENMTGQRWLDKYGVTFDWSANGYQVSPEGWEYHDYTITLAREGLTLELPYKAGPLNDDEPTADGILWMHAREVGDGALDWDDYCREYGLDPLEASVRDLRTWEAIRDQHRRVYNFCDSQAMWEDFCNIREVSDEDDDEN